MTYQDLYRAASTWEARHIAQDLYFTYGASEVASEQDIQEVSQTQVREGGQPIISTTSSVDNLHSDLLAVVEAKDANSPFRVVDYLENCVRRSAETVKRHTFQHFTRYTSEVQS